MQAELTRHKIVGAAAQLFQENGYRSTRLSDIAAAAGVSIQSVQLNGPKPVLLLAALQLVSVGEENFVSVTDVHHVSTALGSITTADAFIRWLADFATASNEQVTGIWWALEHAAAEDASVAEAFQDLMARMRADARRGVDTLLALTPAPTQWDPDQMADLLLALTLPDLYRRLVRELGWSVASYTTWLEQSLRFELLGLTDPPQSSTER